MYIQDRFEETITAKDAYSERIIIEKLTTFYILDISENKSVKILL